MHICQAISQIYAPSQGTVAGGNINAMLHLSSSLAASGHDVSVIAGWPHDHTSDTVRNNVNPVKLRLVPLRMRGPLTRNLELLPRLWRESRRLSKSHSFDLVHGHSGYPHLAALTCILKSNMSIPSVHTLYIPITDRLNDRRYPGLSMGFPVKRILRSIDELIAVSANVRDSLVSIGCSADAIHIVPPSVPEYQSVSAKEVKDRRAELGVGADDFVIVFVGNYTAAKGFDLVIRACWEVFDRLPNVHLVYTVETGPKHHSKRAEKIARLLQRIPEARRTELGIVEDMPVLLAMADLFVLPFRETAGPMDYPMALLEAMAAGTAVVTTRVGGIPELIRDGYTGQLVSSDDPRALTEALVSLLADRARRQNMGRAARQDVRTRFGPDAVRRRMEEVYMKALEKQ